MIFDFEVECRLGNGEEGSSRCQVRLNLTAFPTRIQRLDKSKGSVADVMRVFMTRNDSRNIS